MCRECGKAMEAIKHILNMCEPKGFSLYKKRYERAILIRSWRLLKEYGFKQKEPWYKLEAKPVFENTSVKILWDPSIQKYQKVAAYMRKQFRGYRIMADLMIIRALGTVDTLLEDLRGIPKLSKGAVEVMRSM